MKSSVTVCAWWSNQQKAGHIVELSEARTVKGGILAYRADALLRKFCALLSPSEPSDPDLVISNFLESLITWPNHEGGRDTAFDCLLCYWYYIGCSGYGQCNYYRYYWLLCLVVVTWSLDFGNIIIIGGMR
jgi:hypothetical protein